MKYKLMIWGLIVLCIVIFPIIFWIFQGLWNVVCPHVFGAPELSYGQAAAVYALWWLMTAHLKGIGKSK